METKPRAIFPSNLWSIILMDKHIYKCHHGHDYNRNLSLRVVGAALRMQKGYLQKVQHAGKEKSKYIEKPRIRDTLCDLFHIGHDAYTQIVGGYLHNRKVYVSGKGSGGTRSGNSGAKVPRIPRTIALQISVRDFVRSRRMNWQRVTARQVLDFFVQQKNLIIPVDETGRYQLLPFKSAYRGVQRWLSEFGGYERGKPKGNLVPSPQNVAKKHHYLRTFFANRAKPPGERLREVYTDESDIHEHYHRNEDSLFYPSNNQDVIYQKEKHKGRRYCFCAAIQGPNPLGEEEAPEDLAGFVPGTVWAFCPQKKSNHKGDYHKVFNGDNYIVWFRDQLLANLHQPSFIMLDNAAYHCVYGEGVPQWYKLKKQECIDYLSTNGIDFDPTMSATEMKAIGQAVHRQQCKD
jgi:hypothetical protein